MAVEEFPLPSVDGSYPIPLFFEQQTEEFRVFVTEYDDGGEDESLQAGGSGKIVWTIKYDGLTQTQAAILDAHVASAFYSSDNGSAYRFNLRDRKTGVLYSNVKYAPGGYVKSHTKDWCQAREIILKRTP